MKISFAWPHRQTLTLLSSLIVLLLWQSVSAASPAGDHQITIGGPTLRSVSYDGSTLAIGDFVEEAVYIYEPTLSGWELAETIPAPVSFGLDADFGWQVEVINDVLFVAARVSSSGKTAVYKKSNTEWVYQQSLEGGHDVASDGNTAVTVGDEVNTYTRSGDDTWTHQQTFKPELSYSFVDMDGNVIAVVDSVCDDSTRKCGVAYIFEYVNGSWQQQEEITGTIPGDEYYSTGPHNIAVDGDTVVIATAEELETGNYNAAYVYIRQQSGGWMLQQKLTAPQAPPNGFSLQPVAITGNVILVGFTFYDNLMGRGLVYTRASGVWTLAKGLYADNNSGMGYGVTLAEQTAVLVGNDSRAYSFDLSDVTVEQPPQLAAIGPLSPANGDVDVATDTNLMLTFDEPVKVGAGSIVLTGGTTPIAIDVTDTAQVTVSGSTVTVNPTENLMQGTTYTVTMDIGVIEDVAGYPFEGLTQNEWVFSTSPPSLDVNTDGFITPADALYVLNRVSEGTDLSADVNGDNTVTQADVQAVIDALGTTVDID